MKTIFQRQLENQQLVASCDAEQRRAKLRRLLRTFLAHKPAIREALQADFRKHASEVDLTEVYPVVGEIKHAIAHLPGWLKPQRVRTPVALLGSRSWIQHEPKGVCLLISPWNFPFTLTFGPLASAVAAGNCVILKPSEHTPRSAEVIRQIVGEVFPAEEVAVVTGGPEASQELLELPFQHIFFTGSPAVGKLVMRAAAQHLASVTLELGGKSPTIVDASADLEVAARRIAWAKWVNNGQICIAPDYVFVHEKRLDEFVQRLRRNVTSAYGDDPRQSPSYARLVSDKHFSRVAGYLDSARQQGSQVLMGGEMVAAERYIAPTVVSNPDPSSALMSEEIFGPLLPVMTFRDIKQPVEFIRSREKPLALYLYSRDRKVIAYVLAETRAGGTCINHNAVHFFNQFLPFGGSNFSGIGKSHGRAGFEAFSNPRSVYEQVAGFSAIELMLPPYNRLKQALIDFTVRFL